jgi:hypothetical protein
MKRLGVSPQSDGVGARPGGVPVREPMLDSPRSGDVMFEIGVILALHLAFAFAVIMTLGAFGNA